MLNQNISVLTEKRLSRKCIEKFMYVLHVMEISHTKFHMNNLSIKMNKNQQIFSS